MGGLIHASARERRVVGVGGVGTGLVQQQSKKGGGGEGWSNGPGIAGILPKCLKINE